MYDYVKDKELLKTVRSFCSDIVNQLVQAINRDGNMEVRAYLVGSGARNLVTQNEEEPIDLDFNLEISCWGDDFDICDGRAVKEQVRDYFDRILFSKGLGYCSDSTSCLSTKKFKLPGYNIRASVDLAIVLREGNGSLFRLIHKKTGRVKDDRWYWNEAPNFSVLDKRVAELKDNRLWDKVRDAYLQKKNMYLLRNDDNHPSFVCYIEAVNEVYNANFR